MCSKNVVWANPPKALGLDARERSFLQLLTFSFSLHQRLSTWTVTNFRLVGPETTGHSTVDSPCLLTPVQSETIPSSMATV